MRKKRHQETNGTAFAGFTVVFFTLKSVGLLGIAAQDYLIGWFIITEEIRSVLVTETLSASSFNLIQTEIALVTAGVSDRGGLFIMIDTGKAWVRALFFCGC